MISHGIVNARAVTGQLSSIDGVADAIDVQVAKKKRDLEQEIVILSQLHIINVQQLRDLDHLAVRWITADIHSICQGECESILIEMELMSKMGTPIPYGGFPLTNLKIQDVAVPKDVDQHGDSTDQFKLSPPVDCNGQESTCLLFQYDDLIQMICTLFAV
jgi:hypothetical protein